MNSGVQFTEIGEAGAFSAEQFLAARKPRGHMLYPPTTLVAVENTHNRAGGIVVPPGPDGGHLRGGHGSTASRRCSMARASGTPPWRCAPRPQRSRDPFDVVWAALSKGLGAPAGSLLAGPRELIARAVRVRRMFGGAMRQVGLLAAAGSHAITHHYDRLADDHANARLIAERVAQSPRVRLDLCDRPDQHRGVPPRAGCVRMRRRSWHVPASAASG